MRPGESEGLGGSRPRIGLLSEAPGAAEPHGEGSASRVSGRTGAGAPRPQRVWIAWERQRRSLELAEHLGADLKLFLDENRGWLRYPLSLTRTVRLLRRSRGKQVFVQNPSMILAALAGLLKRPLGYRLVVDRHSNFAFLSGTRPGLKRRAAELLSDLTMRLADMTVVTNAELAAFVEKRGGRPFVLPDPFPRVPASALEPSAFLRPRPPDVPREILFVSSWAFDEPIAEAIEACRALRGQVVVRITGKPKASYAQLLKDAPDNFIPTGFVSDAQYFGLMSRCDAVLAVTTRPCTLVCGAYEALAMGKPMILGDSAALRDYFDDGAVYTDGSAQGLIRAFTTVRENLPELHAGARRLLEKRLPQWRSRLASLEYLLEAEGAAEPEPKKGTLLPLECAVDAAIESPSWTLVKPPKKSWNRS